LNNISAVPLAGGLGATTAFPPFLSSASLTTPLLLLMSGPPVPMVRIFCPPIVRKCKSGDALMTQGMDQQIWKRYPSNRLEPLIFYHTIQAFPEKIYWYFDFLIF
jgi:hypothetical protein